MTNTNYEDGLQELGEIGRQVGRRIVLFSDGTGNSSGKLFKTNVWRLYEALDLGPTGDGEPEQIAFYSNGVGTSTFRPLALIGGVFGVGLKANVLELYKYLCRNWRPDDEIYLFGFSRGAFTIRLLVGLIASQGILRGGRSDGKSDHNLPPDEDELAYRARAAYRAFAGSAWPNRFVSRIASRGVRAVRDAFIGVHRLLAGRKPYVVGRNCFTDIAFVGVWDTVAAYGGPIVEITRGIDDWIWPLTMPNYQLSPRVREARHALALDDERDAFQPLLWDEVREEMLVRWGCLVPTNNDGVMTEEPRRVHEGRLKQVWFSGVHADVGGGYPDESLSFVSLLWMIDELDDGLRLLPEHVRRISSMSNAYGPLHDSRSGLAGYYRFQPRRIRSMLDWFAAKSTIEASRESEVAAELAHADGSQPVSGANTGQRRAAWASAPRWFRATSSLRDPEIADRRFLLPELGSAGAPKEIKELAAHIRRDHGLLTSVRVHESAIARVVSGTDNYAPIGLPRRFDVVFAAERGASKPMLDPRLARCISEARRDGEAAEVWEREDLLIGDMIWWRRIQYFSLVMFSILLATMPLWAAAWDKRVSANFCVDGRCVARPVLELANRASGGFFGPWVGTFSTHMLITIVLGGCTVGLFTFGAAYDLRLRSRSRRAWRASLASAIGSMAPVGQSKRRGIASVRESLVYQRMATALKWMIAPFVTGISLFLSLVLLVVALIAQLFVYPVVEKRAQSCELTREELAHDPERLKRLRIDEGRSAEFDFVTNVRCVRSGRSVQAGKDYAVRVTIVADEVSGKAGWRDGTTPASSPTKLGADLPWPIDVTGFPFRRVTLAGWLQPITMVRADVATGFWSHFPRRIDIDAISLSCDPVSGGYVGRVRPRIDGLLDMSVNDALAPWSLQRFYDNNRGAAVVQVWSGKTVPPPVANKFEPIRCTGRAA